MRFGPRAVCKVRSLPWVLKFLARVCFLVGIPNVRLRPTGALGVCLLRSTFWTCPWSCSRCVRAIGGGWSEQLHVDAPLALLEERWSTSLGLPSARTCPLCSGGPGTPRHVVMSCPAMRPLVDMLRDCLECELASLVQPSDFTEKASAWRYHLAQQGLGVLGRAETRRWPLLAMWRFLIPIPQRELTLSPDVGGSSAAAVASGAAFDLGYRAVMCAEFGRALCSSVVPNSHHESDPGESFSVIFQPSAVSHEIRCFTQRQQNLRPAILFTTLLLLGLRRIRVEYAKRIAAWRACAEVRFSVSLPVPPPPALAQGSLFLRWLESASGKGCVWEWRWLLPPPSVLEARVRREGCGVRALSAAHLLAIQNLGVPILVNGSPMWGPSPPSWDEVRAALSLTCGCPSSVLPDPPLSICARCGRARVAPPCSPEDVLPCIWCRRSHGPACRLCCHAVHFRGECAWNRGA